MLAYEIQKITKMFGGMYWNRMGWIETEEDDREGTTKTEGEIKRTTL